MSLQWKSIHGGTDLETQVELNTVGVTFTLAFNGQFDRTADEALYNLSIGDSWDDIGLIADVTEEDGKNIAEAVWRGIQWSRSEDPHGDRP